MDYKSVNFYMMARPEDCALFRGSQIEAERGNPQTKVVFIHVTTSENSASDRSWEAGAYKARDTVRVASGAAPSQTMYRTQINEHPIVVYECGNTVTYDLRLPDGNIKGQGFVGTNYESLSRLRDWRPYHPDELPCPIHAVDGSTTYDSWQDFCATLVGILSHERRGIYNLHPWINVPDYGVQSALADHKAIADAVRSFARNEFYNRAWWLTFSNTRLGSLPYRSKVERIRHFAYPNESAHNTQWERKDFRLVPWYQPDLDLPDYEGDCL